MSDVLCPNFNDLNLNEDNDDDDDDSDLDENYEDVNENFPPSNFDEDLLSTIEITRVACLQFFNNEPDKAKAKMIPSFNKSVYYAVATAALSFIGAITKFDEESMISAAEMVKKCTQVIHGRRHKGSLTNNVVTKIVVRPNYDLYTDDEVQAEICYADCVIMRAILIVFQHGNLMSYLKGGLKIRRAHEIYKECRDILEHRTHWSHEQLKDEFESGVDIGIGVFNLVVSTLPPRMLTFLQFIGFSGDRELAFKRLTNGQQKLHTVRGPLCSFILLFYHIIYNFMLGYPKKNDELFNYCNELLKPVMETCPNGTMLLFFSGRLEHLQGNISTAIAKIEKLQNGKLEAFQLLSVLELFWISASFGEWRKAAFYVDILCRTCNWSKCLVFYLKGCVLMMCDDRSEEDEKEILHCMREVPKHIHRFLGRSFPLDKFCFRKTERFFVQDKWLPLPIYEIMFAMNHTYLLKGKNDILEPILVCVERSLVEYEQGDHRDSPWHFDNYCLLVFLKGLCLFYMGYPLSAEEYFIKIVENQNQILKDKHVLSFALMELGCISKEVGNREQAFQYFTAARTNSIFITEFRIHQGLEELRQMGFHVGSQHQGI